MAAGKAPNDRQTAYEAPAGRLLGPVISPPAALAAHATKAATSRGRFYRETESATRSCYQRDRDRIIHAASFRRLKHKTQVFVQHEGDYYRTRLTHSLEVAQIARSLARVLAVDEDLAEAVALAHDLGHTPFGHAGEDALNEVTRSIGGFDHNAHALRLLTRLEHRYAGFDGLNLTWETLEGLVKHNGPPSAPIPGPIASFDARWPLQLSTFAGLEAQIAALSDDIAYVNHDIDDGLRAGLFSIDDLTEAPLAGSHASAVLARFGRIELGRFIGELVRTLMSQIVDDLLAETRRRLSGSDVRSAAEVRAQPRALVSFTSGMEQQIASLKSFLVARMYHHPRVLLPMERAKAVVVDLYEGLVSEPSLLPPDWADVCGGAGDALTQGVVRDYIAGMTDNYALAEYRRIFRTEIVL
jgi:dGTPase